jgi:hypothetical protein
VIITMNTKLFDKQMKNIIDYSVGFLDGIHKGKKIFLDKLGLGVINALAQYVDIEARSNPKALHHIYEWNQTGSPSARLFDLRYTVSNLGLSINSSFRQSRTVSENMTVPFYNKAKIMENGVPVTIAPTKAKVLKFNGPSGDMVYGSFEKTVDEFILKYLKQSFLKASGLYDYIKKPQLYKKNIKAGSRMGKAKGVDTGFKWIANATIGVE